MESVSRATDQTPIADLPPEEQSEHYLNLIDKLDPGGKVKVLSVMNHLGMNPEWPFTTDVLATMTGIIKAADPDQREGSAMEGFVEALHRELEPQGTNDTEKLPPRVWVDLEELRIPEESQDIPANIARGSSGVHVVSVHLPTEDKKSVAFGREKIGSKLQDFDIPPSGFKGAKVFSHRAIAGKQPALPKAA